MLTRIISDPSNLSGLTRKDTAVHFSRRPKLTQLLDVLTTCPRLKRISICPTIAEHFGQAARKLLEREGIELVVSDAAWGARHEMSGGLVEMGEDET
ncbi:DUF1699 family protein [Candidatus Pacearchaeota archaeon]|jgi:hypothetical protein|nr:DUF1699 family protein [Candidatus Pacearchaeota archaeon]